MLIQLSPDEKDQATYFADTAEQKDYDIDISGWGGDYSDPKTYLAILDPETGSQLKNMGLSEGKDKEVKDKIGLSDYKKLLDQADAEITDTQARYEKYADAQAWLTDSALFLPVQSGGATQSSVRLYRLQAHSHLLVIKEMLTTINMLNCKKSQ